MVNLVIEATNPLLIPQRMTEGSVGFDVCAEEYQSFSVMETHLVSLGFKMQLPSGYWAMLVPRSSLHKRSLVMPNSVGVIDQDYRLTVKMPLKNIGKVPTSVEKGERIGQIIILPILQIEVNAGTVDTTKRGGFGSTN